MLYKYETHLHTAESSACATGSGAEMARAFRDAGYTGVIVTDHFINDSTTVDLTLPWREQMLALAVGYDCVLAEGKKLDLDVFFGWEMPHVPHGHDYLVYNLDLEFLLSHPNLDQLEMEKFCALAHENGGFICRAHPFRKAKYIEYPATVTAEWLDAIEVNNGASDDPENFNSMAWDYARNHRELIRTSGGDSHDIHKAGVAGMAFPYRLRDSQHLVEALRAGDGMPIIDGIVCDREGNPVE